MRPVHTGVVTNGHDPTGSPGRNTFGHCGPISVQPLVGERKTRKPASLTIGTGPRAWSPVPIPQQVSTCQILTAAHKWGPRVPPNRKGGPGLERSLSTARLGGTRFSQVCGPARTACAPPSSALSTEPHCPSTPQAQARDPEPHHLQSDSPGVPASSGAGRCQSTEERTKA